MGYYYYYFLFFSFFIILPTTYYSLFLESNWLWFSITTPPLSEVISHYFFFTFTGANTKAVTSGQRRSRTTTTRDTGCSWLLEFRHPNLGRCRFTLLLSTRLEIVPSQVYGRGCCLSFRRIPQKKRRQ